MGTYVPIFLAPNIDFQRSCFANNYRYSHSHFNRASIVSRAIDSVLSQTRLPSEIIVVDDGSTDNTESLISEKYRTVSYIKSENKGVSAARNIGIKAAKSEWIAFLDSDDEWLPQKVEKQIAKISHNPSYKVVHCEEIWIRDGRRVNPKVNIKNMGDIFLKNAYHFASFLLRRLSSIEIYFRNWAILTRVSQPVRIMISGYEFVQNIRFFLLRSLYSENLVVTTINYLKNSGVWIVFESKPYIRL